MNVAARHRPVLRQRGSTQRVTNAELFFDLVYVFAITQLSHHLIGHLDLEGALQTLILLGLVWLVWIYTTWVTNWLDPDRIAVRVMLLACTFGSLVLSLALPDAFGSRAWAVAGAYAGIQIARSVFVVVVLRGEVLQRNFQRILCWSICSGVVALLGAAGHGHVRELLWIAAIVIDLLGGAFGFYTPGLGRSRTDDWTIDGAHIAERCQAFILIALGESVVVIGATLAGRSHISTQNIVVFVVGFLGVIGLWWIYFDRSAEGAANVIGDSSDPGRLGRSAYHLIHPIMVAGIIVLAAADQLVLQHPLRERPAATWTVLGGTALFIGGHALFKATVWRVWPWTRLVAVAVLTVLVPLGSLLPALVLALCALAVTLAVVVADAVQFREPATSSA